jgi:hypothetical protein
LKLRGSRKDSIHLIEAAKRRVRGARTRNAAQIAMIAPQYPDSRSGRAPE